MSMSRIAQCPYCYRSVRTTNGRYNHHGDGTPTHPDTCPLSGQLVPVTGMTDDDHEARARLVVDLAEQVQDRDPRMVWQYLTALPPAELQRIAMIAIAAVPVQGTVTEPWAWVAELPDAKAANE